MASPSDPSGAQRTLGVVLLVAGVGIAIVGLLAAGIGDMSMEGFANRRMPSAVRGVLAVVLGGGIAVLGYRLQRRR